MIDSVPPHTESKLMQTVDKLTRFASEDLARTLDRRSFIKRAGTGAFLALAGLATGQGFFTPRRAAAAGPGGVGTRLPPTINCSPPGPYCNNGGGQLSGCHGAHCFSHLNGGQLRACHVYYQYYPGGCWTNGSGNSAWTCCDCQCSDGSTCGCAQLSGSPGPSPTGGSN